MAFFYMREHTEHETNLTQQILLQKIFPTFSDTHITHLPSFVLFRDLAFK